MRCKSCNAIMEPDEIIWYEEYQTHEELCSRCLDIMHELDDSEEDGLPALERSLGHDDGEWDMGEPAASWEGPLPWDD